MLRGIVEHQTEPLKPLISAEEWETAKRLLSRRARSRVSTSAPQTHLFSGLVVCASCGRSLHRRDGLSPGALEMLLCAMRLVWPLDSRRAGSIAADWLTSTSSLMALEAQQANNAKGSQKSLVQVEAENKLAALMQLHESGCPNWVNQLTRSVIRLLLCPPGAGARLGRVGGVGCRWSGQPTDEELRVIFLEFFECIRFDGNPRSLSFELRGSSNGDAKDGGG